MSGAMAFLAGMGTGYIDGKKRKQDQDRLDAKDKREQELFDMTKAEKQLVIDDRNALNVASAPATVREMEGPQPEAAYAGLPAGQEPKPLGYIAGNGTSARGFAEKGLADASAAEQNKPGANRVRMADLARQGNTQAATALANDASIRNHTAQATIAEQTLADQTTARSIQALADFDSIGAYVSESQADNNGGKFKGKFIPSADGKTQVFNRLNEDGTYAPTQRVFANTPQGLTQAKEALAGAMTPEQRRVQAQQIIANELAAKEAERKARHDEGTLAVAQQNANTNEQWRKDQAAAARETNNRLAASAKAAGATAGAGAYWSKDADEHIVKLNSFTNPETGRSEIDGNGAQFMQRVALDIAGKNGGNTMAAIARAAEVDQALKAMAKNDPAMLAQLRNKALADASAPRALAPSAPVATSPASTARAGVSQAPAAPAPTQDFNEAGYRDVQSTIDGARRGDKNALSVLQMLITRGDTTPAQRQQIANITQ